MISRDIEKSIISVKDKIPVIVITGPRQSGKITLAKALFPNILICSFLINYQVAKNDPRMLLNKLWARQTSSE